MPSGNLIPLAKGSVLYLGSAVPLETSVGIEALQMPLRDRYLTTDAYQKVSGIDAILTVFSGGLLMQYPGDESSSTWFSMQTLHMCAAVKAVSNMGTTRFESVDSPQAQASREPPIFAVIMRRSKGVKVLECHVFVCKSTDASLSFVQSCTHAFQHQEGWMNGTPGSDQFGFGGSRIVAADMASDLGVSGMQQTPLQGFMYSPDQQTHMYNISGNDLPRAPAPVQLPAPPPPAPVQAPAPAPATVQILQPQAQQQQQPVQIIAMNPPGAPVAQVPQMTIPQVTMPQMAIPQMTVPQMTVPQMTIPQGYFADWDQNFGMTYMVVPDSPFYPGDEVYNKEKKKRKKKKKKKGKKQKEEEEDLYYVRRSNLDQGRVPPEFVPVDQSNNRYSSQGQTGGGGGGGDYVRYVSEPMGPPAQPQRPTTDIYLERMHPPSNPPPTQVQRSTTDIYMERMHPPTDQIQPTTAEVYFARDYPADPYSAGQGLPNDPYAYRVQPPDAVYDYKRDYSAARQQPMYARGQQGVYERKLPRTDYHYDDRVNYTGMAKGLDYLP